MKQTQEEEDYTEDERNFGYGYQLVFALVTLTIVFNIILIVRIKYGDHRITHLTLQPYKTAMVYLFTQLFETTISILMQVVEPELFIKFNKKEELSNRYEEFLTTVAFLSTYVKYLFLIIFIGTQAFEFNILNYFVVFQRKLRL